MPEFKKLVLEHGEFETVFTTKYEKRTPYAPVDPDKLLAFLPGVIQTLGVEPGAKVSKGDRLLTFEAMKMENSIFAPRDGVIGAVHVKIGQMVPKGTVLVEMKAL